MSNNWSVVEIDASGHCQLACPACPTASGEVRKALGAGHLAFDDFAALLDRNPNLAEVELSNWGEMFLNPRLTDMMKYAFERGVTLHADNGVNLNHASAEALEGLVKYRFRSLTCSIDGASAETYAQYRVNGKFERVMENIQKINIFKRRYNSGFPALEWQFVVFGHNEHEIAVARKLAEELGMGFRSKLSWDEDVSPIRNRALVQIQTRTPVFTREEYYQKTGREYARSICYQLWRAPVLNWDGRVTGCCRNFWGDFGSNAFRDGLTESLDSEPMKHARKMLFGRAEARADIPCSTCDLFHTMQRDKSWMTEDEVHKPKSGILVSVALDAGASEATHADIFIGPGHLVNRKLFVQPPQASRYEIGKSHSVFVTVPDPGEYTVYVLPKRMDPAYRKQYPPMEAVTMPVTITARPVAQECTIRL